MNEAVVVVMTKANWREIVSNIEDICGQHQDEIEILQDVAVIPVDVYEDQPHSGLVILHAGQILADHDPDEVEFLRMTEASARALVSIKQEMGW